MVRTMSLMVHFVGCNQLSRFRKHRLGAQHVDKVLIEIVKQVSRKGIIKSKSLLIDSTHMQANASKRQPLEVLRKAASRLRRSVKKHIVLCIINYLPILMSKIYLKKNKGNDGLHYLAQLGEEVEEALPDAEGSIKKITCR
uniref:Uncharacterized protein n=1 Tax=Anaerobacillus isosaccharinicus TaxID=1532552 RepID=A0A7S7RC18_9BACI|nr:hypothetical protein [Anaerobacillus isosaccharinicus]QOY36500.1 hypothetical protein AWH56_002075 [Anaerobacillus isosaccharinicus]